MMDKMEFIDKINKTTFILIGDYINTNTKTEFKCKKCFFIQKIRPGHILYGSGCSNCSGVRKKTHEEYINDLSKIHKTIVCIGKYEAARKSITHKCLICNHISNYIPNNLLRGQGCSKCANNQCLGTEEYKEKLKEKLKKIKVLEEYKNRSTKINHLCLICNCEFFGRPSDILNSKSEGCPFCKVSSIGEKKIKEYLDKKNIEYIRQHKNKLCKNIRQLPFDFYLKKFNVYIEYDGEHHFEPNRFGSNISEYNKIKINDQIKDDWCLKNKIKLIRIPYYDINRIESIIDSVINIT